MATPDPSVPPVSITPAPSPAAPSLPAPAAPAPAPERRVVEKMLIGVVLAFAFLAASAPVRNSDFWMHLAGGRLVAEGRYSFGVDPFAYTTGGVYWANHAWLFDLLLYLIYNSVGGGVLVVLKALAVAGLAAALLQVRRSENGVALPVVCTLLAVLAMSPRLFLHSTCVSYVFLGLSFWLIWRPKAAPATFREGLKRYAPLLVLFALWVNVDDWFLLGPLLAGLFWLGERLPTPGAEAQRTPAWLAPVGLAVGLINPHHWHAFTLPADLTPLPAELRPDPRFQGLFVSPWHLSLLYQPATGVNLAAAAFYALLVLGAASFLLNARRTSGRRLLVWLSFAALAAWLARAVPFFAVVAAPVTALNLQETLASDLRARRTWGPAAAYSALFLSGLSLMALAWLGWLRGFPMAGRGVAWEVQEDGSLRHVAETLRDWRHDGRLGEGDRGFAVHPNVVHYCAWFCPEEKGFLDHRLPLFRSAAGDYEAVCQALRMGTDPGRGAPTGDWRAVLRRHGITHLIVYDPQLARLAPALQELVVNEGDWTLLHVDGQALIVGRNGDGGTQPEGVPPFDADRLAFSSDPQSEAMLPPAPEQGPGRGPRPADFPTQIASVIPPPPWEAEAAGVLLRLFEDRIPREVQHRGERGLGWFAGLPGLPASPASLADGPVRLLVHFDQMPAEARDVGQQPPALPLLAVRAARRALAVNPDDANAYVCLGQAYRMLAGLTPERTVLGTLGPLDRLRHVQAAAALESALLRKPDLVPVHEELANLYEGRNYLDAALEHRRESVRLARRDGPLAGESAEAFARRLEHMSTRTRELERYVGDLKNEFALRSQGRGGEPYRKARLALSRGLARLALEDVLKQTPMVLLASEGIALQVELQLMLGQVEPARERLHDPDWISNKAHLGFVDMPAPPGSGAPTYRLPAYEWLLFCQAAADGDYAEAESALRALLDELEGPRAVRAMEQLRLVLPRSLATELALSASGPSVVPRQLVNVQRLGWSGELVTGSFFVVEHADLHVLAGMLSLESGRPAEAARSFETAVSRARLGSASPQASAGRPLAETYLRLLRPPSR